MCYFSEICFSVSVNKSTKWVNPVKPVPAAGDFKVLSVRTIQQEEQCVLVPFSDPVKIGQKLGGLISVSDQSDISYTIKGSEVKCIHRKGWMAITQYTSMNSLLKSQYIDAFCTNDSSYAPKYFHFYFHGELTWGFISGRYHVA